MEKQLSEDAPDEKPVTLDKDASNISSVSSASSVHQHNLIDNFHTVQTSTSQYEDNNLSFRSVKPVNIAVRDLSATVAINPSFIDKLRGGKVKAAEKVHILSNVSADLPTGQLTALIGASGSGKVV